MIPFLILATVLVAGALLLVVPPLLGGGSRAREQAHRQRQAETVLVVLREQLAELEAEHAAGHIAEADYQRSREELEQRALEEGRAAEGGADLRPARKWAVAVVVALPALAVLFYLALGEPRGLDPAQIAAQEEHQITPEQMSALVAQLAQRLEREPNDVEGWMMLGRSYSMTNDLEGAAATWRKLGAKIPDQADILADWADLLAGAAGGKFDGEPDRLIRRALELDPAHLKALALAGTAAFQREDFAAASAHWERILANMDPGEGVYGAVVASINEARAKGGMPLLEAAGPGAAPTGGSGGKGPRRGGAGAEEALKVSGRISISAELAAQVEADDTVFVFARPLEGGMPVAALRLRAGDLPASFSFENAPRMSKGPLPAQLSIGARLSKHGEATAQAGDLEGEPVNVAPDAANVEIVIDRLRN
ncbi:c-type cytochrome biogenesis protein CcmI [Aromatoleum buckelii]|uniref:c-type cytochrome biogenesis protein CcmI n=1 Tax=Aromatoleum buckelii TaxID=200254 RepID=UPI001FF4C225|nr:c-type cytochrome biogenesis protein CcmI [Aromatoleum buckelii]MCK0510335.1 c-type cytochrome biogenesis protein CcmI [Aromatoleum buckelii]